jgi:PAS domain S-box-containing protein
MSTQAQSVEPLTESHLQLQKRVAELEAQVRMLKARVVQSAGTPDVGMSSMQKLGFLEEVSRRLSQSLDLKITLGELARLAVPTLGDWCAVYLPKEDGTLDPWAVHHNDPRKVELVLQLLKHTPIRQDAAQGTGAAFRTGQPQLIPFITDAMIEAQVTDPERLANIKRLEIRSGMNLPLVSHGQVLGVIDVVSSDPQRPYVDADLTLGMEFAQRVTAALDNARLYDELRKANERFELAERASGGYVYEWDQIQGKMVRSASFATVTGYDEPASRQISWLDLIHPEDRHRVQQETAAFMRAGGTFSIEYRLRHRDGHFVHVWNQGTVLLNNAGQAMRTVGIVVDISKRKQIEEDLRKSEAQMRQMADAMPQLVWISNAAGEVSYYNQRAAEYAGLQPNAAGLWQWQPVLLEDDLAATVQAWQAATDTGQPYVKEHRLQMASGEYRWHLSRAYPARDEHGRITNWFGTATDIHDLKLAQEAREMANYRFRVAEEAANGFSFEWDVRAGTVVRSSGLKRVLGYDENELPQGWAGWASLVHPEDVPGKEADLIAALNQFAGDTKDSEYRARDKNGKYHWLYERAILLRDEQGKVRRVIGQTVDITERKQSEARLRESEARFRHLADAMPVLVWLSDTTKHCTWFNRNWLSFTGRTMAQEYGHGWVEGVHPADKERCFKVYEEAFDRHEAFEMDYRLRRHDGEYRWLLDRGVPNFAPDGEFLGFIGGCIDIHDRRQAEHDARFLAGIGVMINSAPEPQAVMWNVVNATAEYLGTARAGFNEVDAAQGKITFHRDYSRSAPSIAGDYTLASFGRVLAREMRAGKTLAISDTQHDPRSAGEYEAIYAPVGLRAILSVPMMRNGQWMASLWVAEGEPRAWTESEIDLLRTVAERTWVAVESARVQAETQALNATLEARVAERTKALRESQMLLRQLSAYVARAREDERSRMAREVHDELGGALTVLKMSLAQIMKRIEPDASVAPRLDDLRNQIDVLVQSVRRISYDLRPSMLDDFGLLATMEWQAQEWQQRTGIACTLDLPRGVDAGLNDKVRTAVFRVFQESLTNVARHAQATEVRVSARLDNKQLTVTVQDNGRGFGAAALQNSTSLGLMGMRERMSDVGGSVEITSVAGQGATVVIRVPAT